MRALVVTSSYPETPGDPSGHFVASEVRALVARGYTVTLVVPRGNAPRETPRGVILWEIAAGDAFGFPGVRARLAEPGLLKCAGRLSGILRFLLGARRCVARLARVEGVFDLVQAHWLLPGVFPLLPPGIAREAEWVTHGSDARLLRRMPTFAARGMLETATRAAKVTRLRAVSSELLAALAPLTPRSVADRRVEACAIDLGDVPARDDARRLHGVEGELWVVVARLIASKRVDVALEKSLELAQTRPISVVVIGDGPMRASLEARFPHARFLGQLPRPTCLSWMAAADGLLSASLLEGAPTAIREARALGVPVLCAPAGDLARWAETDPGLCLLA
ncbi:MAG: glycosyltransferase family 4 protein [Myxococcales bacterium]|nr:glycosyltransferase family 4 protein [Myxococcales bacterium]